MRMTDRQKEAPANSMDANNLYEEAVFTDQKVGTIRRMTPVTSEGEKDPGRTTLYFGQAQMMTPAGATVHAGYDEGAAGIPPPAGFFNRGSRSGRCSRPRWFTRQRKDSAPLSLHHRPPLRAFSASARNGLNPEYARCACNASNRTSLDPQGTSSALQR